MKRSSSPSAFRQDEDSARLCPRARPVVAIPYAGQTCDRAGYVKITEPLYDPIVKWSYNAQHYGVTSVLTAFQIRARLATLDERSSGGFGILGVKILAEYQWSEHLKFADLFLLDGLNDDGAATRLIEQPLADLHLGSGRGIDFMPRRGSLTSIKRRAPRTPSSDGRISARSAWSRRIHDARCGV